MSEMPHQPPASDELDLSRRRMGDVSLVTVTGEIDMRTAPALTEAIVACLDQADGPCILDLTGVAFLGSHGLSALLEGASHAHDLREPLRIVVDSNRPVIRPLEITGLDQVLSLYHTVDEALAATG